jgi:hypothetical protein
MQSTFRVMHVFLAAEAIALLIVVALRVSGNLPVGDASPAADRSGI